MHILCQILKTRDALDQIGFFQEFIQRAVKPRPSGGDIRRTLTGISALLARSALIFNVLPKNCNGSATTTSCKVAR